MLNKILIIALGGTIGSIKTKSIALDKNNFKVLDYINCSDIEFERVSPFSILSEDISIAHWKTLIELLCKVDFDKYDGVIILHGSDTLAFTAAIVANAFPDNKIVLVAADKPIENKSSNGIKNLNLAIDYIINSSHNGVMVAYDKIYRADCITSADINDKFISINSELTPLNSRTIYDKNILIISPYVGIKPENYDLSAVDAVLISMFHSATVPKQLVEFARNCSVPVYFVSHRQNAEYETAQDIENIIFNCTIENAYARFLLTKQN